MDLAGIAGLEPTHARIKIWCLTDLAISLYMKERKRTDRTNGIASTPKLK